MSTKTNTNIITVEELIARKEKLLKKEKATAVMHVKSLGCDVKIEEPSSAILADVQDMDDQKFANKYVVYECIVDPNVKDPKLHEAFGNPPIKQDILDFLMKEGEITALSGECAELAGYGSDSITLVKN